MCSFEDRIKISIIVPVYKVPEEYLRGCIESLINQNFEDYEVIIVDDGSPDNCGAICDEYQKLSDKIQVIHKENEGVSVARNYGLEVAKGTYIMFVDGDDKILKNTLVDIYNILKEQNADISLFKYLRTGDTLPQSETRQVNILDEEEISNMKKGIMTKQEMLEGICVGSPWAKVFRTDYIRKNNIRYVPGTIKAEDRTFMLICIKNQCSVQWIDYTYYYYNTENETSACKKYDDKIFNNLLITASEIEKLVNNEKFCEEIQQMYMKFFIEIMVLNIFHEYNTKSMSENVEHIKEIANNEKFGYALARTNLRQYGISFSVIFYLIKKKLYKTAYIFGKIRFGINKFVKK